MIRQRSVYRGVTLVEVAISTAIVGFMIVAALETVGNAVRTHQVTSAMSDAWRVAEAYAAKVADLDFEELDNLDGSPASPPENHLGASLEGMSDWIVALDVARCEADPDLSTGVISDTSADEGLRRVKIKVTYSQDPEHAVELEILRSRNGASPTPSATPGTIRGLVVEWRLADSPLSFARGVHLNGSPSP